MEVLDVRNNFATGDKLAAADFNKLVLYVKGLATAIDSCMAALNIQGLNIDFVTQSEYNTLVANDTLDQNTVYIIK